MNPTEVGPLLRIWLFLCLPFWVAGYIGHRRATPSEPLVVIWPFWISVWFGSLDGIIALPGMMCQLVAFTIGFEQALAAFNVINNAQLNKLNVWTVVVLGLVLVLLLIFARNKR